MEVAYGRGAFDERAIQLTATLMLCQLPAVLTETIRLPLATVFFSHGRTLTAISFGLVRVALMLVLYPFVWEPWGAYGLALAMGVADIITVGVMLVGARSILGLKLPGLPWFGLRLGLASALTCAFALGAWTVASTQLGLDGTLEQLLGLGVVAAVSCLLGGVLARAMGLKEASELVALLASIARRKRGAAPGAGR